MISNSGHDEHGRYSAGAAGDQTGTEWQLRGWYNRPWDLVLRYPDKKVAQLIADLSKQAAENNLIGYDQGQRLSYWYALQEAGYYPKNITKKCEADCSSGVLANVRAAGYILGIAALKKVDPSGWTGSMKSQLCAAGFTPLTAMKYRTSDQYLLPGDILLNEMHHTAVNISTGSSAAADNKTPAAAAKPAADATSTICKNNLMKGQQWLNDYYGDFLDRVFGAQLVVDGEYGQKTRAAALAVWKDVCNRLYATALNIKSGEFDSNCRIAANKYALVGFFTSGTHTLICKMLLSAKGYYRGKMDSFGNHNLCLAIQAYEEKNGLTVDSGSADYCEAGAQVWGSLFGGI